jgi:hypothetical protein
VLPENDPQGVLYLPAGPEAKGFIVVDATLTRFPPPASGTDSKKPWLTATARDDEE